MEQKNVLTQEEGSNPTGLVWNANTTAFSLFWETNMAHVTSCENAVFSIFGRGDWDWDWDWEWVGPGSVLCRILQWDGSWGPTLPQFPV